MTDKGITFIIMPLLSLIEDNFNFVKSLGIDAVSLSDGGSTKGWDAIQGVAKMKYKLVYVTPEKIVSNSVLRDVIDDLYRKGKIDRFVIDEVHCVSSWGADFRSDYLELKQLKKNYPRVPILGLTATASQAVKTDICDKLGISNEVCYFQNSFNRPNLVYEIRNKHNISNLE